MSYSCSDFVDTVVVSGREISGASIDLADVRKKLTEEDA